MFFKNKKIRALKKKLASGLDPQRGSDKVGFVMSATDDLIPVRVVGIMPASTGMAVFLGNEEKTFSLHVDQGVGMAIAILLKGEKRERPLTHDLISLFFTAFNIVVERVVINDLRNDTYFARLTLRAENEIHKKITEIDARPSDCIAIALESGKPILVSPSVWNQVTDISSLFQNPNKDFDVEGGPFDPMG